MKKYRHIISILFVTVSLFTFLSGCVDLSLLAPKEPVTINFSADIIFKGLNVHGVIGRRMYDTWLQMQTFLSSGIFDPMPAVTHTFPLEDIQKALDVIHSGNAGKVILEIGSK